MQPNPPRGIPASIWNPEGPMPLDTFAPFVLASMALLLTPGPTNTILAASSAAMGLRRAWMLPLAEAAGYVIAIFAFVRASELLADIPIALPALKGFAAAWLLYSAYKLWTQSVEQRVPAVGEAIKRVFLTTLLNPKAMLVGTIIIPTALPTQAMSGVLLFPCLSIAAGALWMTIGSAVPSRLRPFAYKGAACIIGVFSFAAASSAAHLI